MNLATPDPDLPELIEPDRAEHLLDAACSILDLALATGDESLAPHIHACTLADELLFRAEAVFDAAHAAGNHRLAQEEGKQAYAARQLKLWHLDRLDRHLFPESH